MTADFIAFHAAERPGAAAFVENGRTVTYSAFNRDLRRFMQALSEHGLRRGHCVAVGCDGLYLHWVLVLAFQRLGVATTSLLRTALPAARLAAKVDIVFSEWDFPSGLFRQRHPITAEWINHVRGLPEVDDIALPSKAEDDVVLVAGTAGTTGEPKLVRSSRRTDDARRDSCIWILGLSGRSRYLLTSTFDTGFILPVANAVACVGGTVIAESRQYIGAAIVSHAITHLLLFPIHLKMILDSLPEDFAKPRDLTVVTFGATLPETLRERAMARLATVLFDNYGSREASFVSRITASGSGGIGTVAPGAEVEVVNEAGTPLPFGQLGRLKIKTHVMQTEYFDNPEATKRSFKDGWLLSEDVGVLHGPRRLQIMGRRDDMMNIGGAKVAPSMVEEIVLRLISARDVGAFSQPSSDGIGEIWIAVVDAQLTGSSGLESSSASEHCSSQRSALSDSLKFRAIPPARSNGTCCGSPSPRLGLCRGRPKLLQRLPTVSSAPSSAPCRNCSWAACRGTHRRADA